MNETNSYLYSKETGTLQLHYADYLELMGKLAEAKHVQQVRDSILADLRQVLGAGSKTAKVAEIKKSQIQPVEIKKADPVREHTPEKVSIEFQADAKIHPKTIAAVPASAGKPSFREDVPPIKKDIAQHFNDKDGSGRLFNVFTQYYTCLNDACGGTVRVTLKDGFCSLWNYDAWEEFAFVDIFDGKLRIAIDPRFTDELKSLDLCEVPRLLSSRRNLICVTVDDLNNRMLDVLTIAFNEAARKQSR